MKAKELAELLMQNPEFDVQAAVVDGDLIYYSMDITGIADIGYSDKVILLDCMLQE